MGVICLVQAAVACGRAPVESTAPAPAAPAQPMAGARDAMQRHDYAVAVSLLRDALSNHPADLEARYRLGVSLSHQDRFDEATREFEWVVAHGDPAAPEVKIARDWIDSRRSRPVAAPPAPATERAPAQQPDLASLSGRAAGPGGPKARLQLFLKGIPGSPTGSEYHILRTDAQGHYHFPNVVPGDYMLTNAVAGPVIWRLRISLARGERRTLDLSPANDASVRDDAPESR